jgi:glucose-1-phosphate adenylyltransferase
MGGMLAALLAGGRGKRMDILCHMRPKPALPFAGRFKVIDFTLSNCLHSRVDDIAVLTDYQRTAMADYLNCWRRSNINGSGFRILEPRAESYRGTADAVYQNIDRLQGFDHVLVLAGDHVYKMDYRRMLAFHRKMAADVTVGVVRVPVEQSYRFGIISQDENHRVNDFTEKPDLPSGGLASMGIYIFNRDILIQRLQEDAGLADSTHDFGYAVIPRMVRKDRVYAYEFDGYWQDIGTMEAYFGANMELLCERPSFKLDGFWPVYTQENCRPQTQEHGPGSVYNSLVSPGCIIKGRVENSILSPGVMVDSDALVRDSILMDQAVVGSHSVVDRCILDKGVSVGAFCYLGFGERRTPGNDITVLGEGVAVPRRTAIGRSCKIMPYTGYADFRTNAITPGHVVSHLAVGGETISDKRVIIY